LESRLPVAQASVLRLELDGHVYVLLPETDGHGSSRERGGADGAGVRAGELITAKGRYIIVRTDTPARSDDAAPGRPIHGLSRRELQIVVLVAEGCVNKQIADQLKISEWTVSTHLRRIFAKLSVDSRAAMVYRCLSLLGRRGSA
jgi:DNA-binding CsgD family transcriptional regulator